MTPTNTHKLRIYKDTQVRKFTARQPPVLLTLTSAKTVHLWTVIQTVSDTRWYEIFVSQRDVSESMSGLIYHWHSLSLQNSSADNFIMNFYTSDKSNAVMFSSTKYNQTSLTFWTKFFFIQSFIQLALFSLFNYI